MSHVADVGIRVISFSGSGASLALTKYTSAPRGSWVVEFGQIREAEIIIELKKTSLSRRCSLITTLELDCDAQYGAPDRIYIETSHEAFSNYNRIKICHIKSNATNIKITLPTCNLEKCLRLRAIAFPKQRKMKVDKIMIYTETELAEPESYKSLLDSKIMSNCNIIGNEEGAHVDATPKTPDKPIVTTNRLARSFKSPDPSTQKLESSAQSPERNSNVTSMISNRVFSSLSVKTGRISNLFVQKYSTRVDSRTAAAQGKSRVANSPQPPTCNTNTHDTEKPLEINELNSEQSPETEESSHALSSPSLSLSEETKSSVSSESTKSEHSEHLEKKGEYNDIIEMILSPEEERDEDNRSPYMSVIEDSKSYSMKSISSSPIKEESNFEVDDVINSAIQEQKDNSTQQTKESTSEHEPSEKTSYSQESSTSSHTPTSIFEEKSDIIQEPVKFEPEMLQMSQASEMVSEVSLEDSAKVFKQSPILALDIKDRGGEQNISSDDSMINSPLVTKQIANEENENIISSSEASEDAKPQTLTVEKYETNQQFQSYSYTYSDAYSNEVPQTQSDTTPKPVLSPLIPQEITNSRELPMTPVHADSPSSPNFNEMVNEVSFEETESKSESKSTSSTSSTSEESSSSSSEAINLVSKYKDVIEKLQSGPTAKMAKSKNPDVAFGKRDYRKCKLMLSDAGNRKYELVISGTGCAAWVERVNMDYIEWVSIGDFRDPKSQAERKSVLHICQKVSPRRISIDLAKTKVDPKETLQFISALLKNK